MKKVFGKVLLILAGLALILASAKGYILGIAGTEITAAVTNVKIEQESRSNDNDYEYNYNVIVSYTFDVDGKQYTGSYEDSYSTYLKAQEAKQRAEEKATVRIKYLPLRPSICAQLDAAKTNAKANALRIALGLLGVVFIVLAFKPTRKRAESKLYATPQSVAPNTPNTFPGGLGDGIFCTCCNTVNSKKDNFCKNCGAMLRQ